MYDKYSESHNTYIKPVLELFVFDYEDIIHTSGCASDTGCPCNCPVVGSNQIAVDNNNDFSMIHTV